MNVLAYLKDIDDEITAHRQEIAKRQVRIQQLEDMRLLMMSREEERAQSNGQGSPFGSLPNGAQISVKDPRLQIRNYAAEHERRDELADLRSHGLAPPAKKRRSDLGMKKGPRADQTAKNNFLKETILDLLSRQPMDAGEIIRALNMKTKPEKQRVYNALRNMMNEGRLSQAENFGPYSLPAAEAAA